VSGSPAPGVNAGCCRNAGTRPAPATTPGGSGSPRALASPPANSRAIARPCRCLRFPHRGKDLPDLVPPRVETKGFCLERRAPVAAKQEVLGGEPESLGLLPGPRDGFTCQPGALAFPYPSRHAGQEVAAFFLDHVEDAVAAKVGGLYSPFAFIVNYRVIRGLVCEQCLCVVRGT